MPCSTGGGGEGSEARECIYVAFVLGGPVHPFNSPTGAGRRLQVAQSESPSPGASRRTMPGMTKESTQ